MSILLFARLLLLQDRAVLSDGHFTTFCTMSQCSLFFAALFVSSDSVVKMVIVIPSVLKKHHPTATSTAKKERSVVHKRGFPGLPQ